MDQLEEFGLAVKAEPIEGERSNEQACIEIAAHIGLEGVRVQ